MRPIILVLSVFFVFSGEAAHAETSSTQRIVSACKEKNTISKTNFGRHGRSRMARSRILQ
jgi:hypothetical protein